MITSTSSGGERGAAGTMKTLPYVLPVSGRDKGWYLNAARAGLLIGVASHPELVSLNTIADPRLGQTGPRRHHFQP
jgi:hypothetical protein